MSNDLIYWQHIITLPAKQRGFHLITDEIKKALKECPYIKVGLLNLFIQHTSASISITENACPDVRHDLENAFNQLAPEDNKLYRHTDEGIDDMPAHIKSALLGSSLVIPIQNHLMCLGTWQGVVLCEHRNQAPARRIIMTAHGKIK